MLPYSFLQTGHVHVTISCITIFSSAHENSLIKSDLNAMYPLPPNDFNWLLNYTPLV